MNVWRVLPVKERVHATTMASVLTVLWIVTALNDAVTTRVVFSLISMAATIAATVMYVRMLDDIRKVRAFMEGHNRRRDDA